MIFTETKIPGVLAVDLERREDYRGFFARAWCDREFSAHDLPRFVQGNMSLCRRKGTIRGLHYQIAPHREAKYLRCISGAVFDVVVDIRKDSPTYGRWSSLELTAQNRRAVYLPPGVAHAFQALSDDAEVLYFASSFYAPSFERGIRWNDPAFNIDWPVREVIVSDKDASWPDYQLQEVAA